MFAKATCITYYHPVIKLFQACGREIGCAGDAKTRSCYLDFLDQHGNEKDKCLTNQPTPSEENRECQLLHESTPSSKNMTIHLFSETKYLTTCYPIYSSAHQKGWCSTRRSGVFDNNIPEPGSGWGFCSTDKSQENCNGRIRELNDEALAHDVVVLHNKHCENMLKENLKVDQPDVFEGKEGDNVLNDIMEKSSTLCIGKAHKHSFANEKFYIKSKKQGTQTTFDEAPYQRVEDMKVSYT